MYLKTNSKQSPCHSFNLDPQSPSFSGLTDNPVGDGDAVVTLFQDDGFSLFSCAVSNFSRIVYKDGTLILTNEPEPTPQPKPDPGIDPITQIQLAIAELAEAGAKRDIENKLAIAELAEAMTGVK